jgi:hypothetical protein
MSFEELKKQWGRDWTAIDKAKADANERFRQLNELLAREALAGGSVDSGDVNLEVPQVWWTRG